MNLYKMIPKVDQLLENDVINKLLKSNSKNLVMESIHEELDNIRNKISSGYDENSITNYIKNLVSSIEKNVYNKNILNRNSKFTLKFLAITSILSALVYYKFQIYVESGLHINIFIVIITTCIFSWLLSLDINIPKKIKPGIIFISNNTLLAYLLSYIVDNIIYPYVNLISNMNVRFSLFPVVVVLNFILTIILVIIVRALLSILRKIYLLSKISSSK